MGRDKAALELEGVALATRIARRLDELFEEVVLVGGDPPADAPGRRVPDVEGIPCALRGLVGALSACRAERVLVVATDLPFVRADLLLGLVAWPAADAVVPRPPDGPQPLCALYRREAVLSRARERLRGEDLSLHGLLASIETRHLEGADLAALDPDGLSLTNLNTPEDLARVSGASRG